MMDTFEHRYVGQAQAAMFLQMSEKDLCRISREIGLGHKELVGMHEEYFFTIDELRCLVDLAAQPVN